MAPRAGAKLEGVCGAQALPQLQAKLRIERARMRLRLLAPLGAKPELERLLAAQGATIEYQDLGLNGQQVCGWQGCIPVETFQAPAGRAGRCYAMSGVRLQRGGGRIARP